MAVIEKPQLVKDFFPRFKRGAIFLIIILQVFILLAIAVALQYFGFFNDNPLAFVGTLVAQSVLGVIASLILFRFVAQPIKHLLAAITHIAGEPTALTPPNPNEEHFVKTGFKPVLQTLYQLAAETPDPLAEGRAQLVKTTPGTVVTQADAKLSIEAALDATICGFVVMNNERKITYANKATPLRVDQDGVQSLDLIFNENDTIEKWWDECDESAVRAEHTWSRVTNKLPNEEGRRFFDIIATYNKGTTSEVVITLIDRTHLYAVGEEELDFIAFAAHELRGPITVIRGYLDVVQDELKDVLQPDQKELFHRLIVSANRLSGYINNILNTSRFDRRHLKMHLAKTTLNDVYDTVRYDMDLRASAQARSLTVDIPNGLPEIAADTASLSEVFANLIDNAIKYSHDGGIINVAASSKGDTVELSIEDHGIGMPGNVVSNLFQKFYRSHRSRETVAGTGIGLYISKAIVESHGGNITVRSEEGKGSVFTVSLPTYQIVADKLKEGNNGNEVLINNEGGWIKNHTMYRG
jgi:signal transduction histidine kinase